MRRRRRRDRGNNSSYGGLKRAITAPLSTRPQGFGPGRTNVNCTLVLPASQYNQIVSFKLGDVLTSTQEFQTYYPRYEVFKFVSLGVTVYPASVAPSATSELYILNRWAESSLITDQSIKVTDGVKIVPANIVRPRTFIFKIENYESNSYNMNAWHDVNNTSAQSWIYFYSGSINSVWAVRFDIRVAFAQPCPQSMPTKLPTMYTVVDGTRVALPTTSTTDTKCILDEGGSINSTSGLSK